MKIRILTTFPEMLEGVLHSSIIGRAIESGAIEVIVTDIRPFSDRKHKNTDDEPFGGGAGMVMLAQPIFAAVEQAKAEGFRGRSLYMSPRGRTLTQKIVEELAQEEELMLLCGHYEGVDERALELCFPEELSIGDYVLTGGELPALILVDSVARLLPGVLGSSESSEDESFTTGLLEYPQYTRPREFMGKEVPEVLLNGNHAEIQKWRRQMSLRITKEKRPDLLETAPLTKKDIQFLKTLEQEEQDRPE